MSKSRNPSGLAYVRDEKLAPMILVGAAIGIGHREIAMGVGISPVTLRKHYGKELKDGKAKANLAIATRLWAKAMAGDNTCLIFWLKAQAGWVESTRLEHTGKDGQPLAAPSFSIAFPKGGPGLTAGDDVEVSDEPEAATH